MAAGLRSSLSMAGPFYANAEDIGRIRVGEFVAKLVAAELLPSRDDGVWFVLIVAVFLAASGWADVPTRHAVGALFFLVGAFTLLDDPIELTALNAGASLSAFSIVVGNMWVVRELYATTLFAVLPAFLTSLALSLASPTHRLVFHNMVFTLAGVDHPTPAASQAMDAAAVALLAAALDATRRLALACRPDDAVSLEVRLSPCLDGAPACHPGPPTPLLSHPFQGEQAGRGPSAYHELARAFPIVPSQPCSPIRAPAPAYAHTHGAGSFSLQSTPAGGRFTAPPTPHTANVDVNGRYFRAALGGRGPGDGSGPGSLRLDTDLKCPSSDDDDGLKEFSPFSPDSTAAQVRPI